MHIKINVVFFKIFFDVDLIKVFIEFVTILFLFCVFQPRGRWDLTSLTRNQTCYPSVGR